MDNKYVLMVSPNDFPNGDAGAVRDMAFANIYQELGYKVVLIGAGRGDREGYYQGVNYYSKYRQANTLKDHLVRFLSSSRDYMTLVNKIIKENGEPKVIHIYSIAESVIGKLIKIAEKNSIPILHDSTEWYSPCEFSHGKLDKAYILKDRLNRKIIRNPIKVIGISSYLTEHFRQRGLQAVRIPVIMDIHDTKTSINSDDKVKLIYAGSPANKDYLKEMVLGIEQLTDLEKKRIKFSVLGASKEQVLEITGLTELSNCIHAFGRVSREAVQEELQHSDFSALLRPAEERYTMAGFPTKSVEAMSHGVAMLCNISSDLGMYLIDMNNSVVVDGYTPEVFAQAIRKILALTRQQINEIKSRARATAENNFDYRLWVDTVKKLIEE